MASMMNVILGGVAAERTLLYLQNYGEGHAAAIAGTFSMSPSEIRKQLTKFEDGGVLVSRPVGRARVYSWNERRPLVKDLRRLLQAALEERPVDEIQKYYRQRRRPRRRGKPI